MAGEQIIAAIKANPISVACGALALALGVGIYFRSDRVPDGDKQLEAKTIQGERIGANLSNGQQLAEQYAALNSARVQIESRMIHPEELAKNLQFFYKLEADTGTKLVDLRQNGLGAVKVKVKGFYLPVGYTVAVRGDYLHLLDFLRRLESGQRFCRIGSATMATSGGTDKDRGNELTLNLSLELLGQP